jgi:hypothetical protein
MHLAVAAINAMPLAASGHTLRFGPWVIVPIVILIVIIGVPVYFTQRAKRRSQSN